MSYKEKLKNIKAFVFDVDGVFTDGSVYLMPGGNMCRVMNVLDGYAVVKALKNNYLIGVITGGNDEMVKHRINYLGIEDYYAKLHQLVDWETQLQETMDKVLWEELLGKSREKACVSKSAVPATAPAPEPTQEGGGRRRTGCRLPRKTRVRVPHCPSRSA